MALIPGNIAPKAGTLLLSEPFMHDGNFKRTVVLITAHDHEGTVGYILNRKLDILLNEVIDQCPESKMEIFLGGPVQRDNLFFVHTLGDLIDGSIEIGKGIFWGGNFDSLTNLIKRNEIKPNSVRFFIGYSGWAEGQLDEELNSKSWIVANLKNEYIFNNQENLWNIILKNMGPEYAQMANYPEDPSLN